MPPELAIDGHLGGLLSLVQAAPGFRNGNVSTIPCLHVVYIECNAIIVPVCILCVGQLSTIANCFTHIRTFSALIVASSVFFLYDWVISIDQEV